MKFLAIFSILLFSNLSAAGPILVAAGLENFQWRTGQVIAISEMIYDPSTFFFEAATGSRFGHVGLVVVENGQVMIYESDPLLNGTGSEPAENFLSRAEDARGMFHYTILGRDLSLNDEQKVTTAAKNLVAKKIPYNHAQMLQDDRSALNCSEFVFRVFQDGDLGPVGEIETVATSVNPNSMNGGLKRLNELLGDGRSPQPEMRVVTPLSVVKSPFLNVLKTTLPVDRILSDLEIYESWLKGGGILAMVTTPMSYSEGGPLPFLKAVEADATKSEQAGRSVKVVCERLLSGGALSSKSFRQFPGNWRKD